jgi:hypothetical protein
MIVLPGPAALVIPLSLGILTTGFIWARRLVKKIQGQLRKKSLHPFGGLSKDIFNYRQLDRDY